MIRSDSFDFGLDDVTVPKEPRPIAEHRLLVHDAATRTTHHSWMTDMRSHLDEGDLLVFNNSRVMPVSLYLDDDTFVLIIEPYIDSLQNVRVICPFKPSVGDVLEFPFARINLTSHEPGWDVYGANIEPRTEGFSTLAELLERHGQFPLPIYIKRQPTTSDELALQNHFADVDGSIAPPVAGTHFDAALVNALRSSGVETAMVTLHVGYGTFRSFKSEYIEDHVMDSERFAVSKDVVRQIDAAKTRGNRIVAVGTTSARVLETLGANWREIVASEQDIAEETRIFIRPPYEPIIVGGLVTNFQYPKLPVIAMAATFVGLEELRTIYLDAYQRGYAFYSYGDAMFLKF